MEFKRENQESSGDDNLFSENSGYEAGEVFMARAGNDESIEDEAEADIESWGVYLQGKDKTLLGLFWDKELAKVFLESVRGSKVLEKVKEIS